MKRAQIAIHHWAEVRIGEHGQSMIMHYEAKVGTRGTNDVKASLLDSALVGTALSRKGNPALLVRLLLHRYPMIPDLSGDLMPRGYFDDFETEEVRVFAKSLGMEGREVARMLEAREKAFIRHLLRTMGGGTST